jgi:hypothetical protein
MPTLASIWDRVVRFARRRPAFERQVRLGRNAHDHVSQGLHLLERRLDRFGRLAALGKHRGHVLSRFVEGDVGRKERRLRRVSGKQLLHAATEHCPHQDVGVEDDGAGGHGFIAACAARSPPLCAAP